jgi:hypothetical protein
MLAEDIIQKLGIADGNQICFVDAPAEAADALRKIAPPSVRFTDYIGLRGFDHILWWPPTLAGLDARLAKLAYCIKPDGAIWLLIPKAKFAAERGITFTWSEMQAIALQTDLVDNKTASFSDTDYATRFVIRKETRLKYR